MNLRASLAGGLVVIIAGTAVGAAIGGKTKTVTRTVTSVRTVSAPHGSTSTATAASTQGTTSTPTTSTAGGTSQGQGSTGFPQYLADIANPSNANWYMVDQSQPVTVNGQTFTKAVSLKNPQFNSCSLAMISFPVPPGAKTLTGSYGWTSDSDSSSSELLDVYLDSTSSQPIWKRLFGSPGDPPVSKHLTVTGAHEIMFQFAGTAQCNGSASFQGTFFLGDARFTN